MWMGTKRCSKPFGGIKLAYGLILIGVLLGMSSVLANPVGGTSIRGDLDVFEAGPDMTVNVSDGAVVGWDSFDIVQGETVNFVIQTGDGGSGSVLNQIGGDQASQINGYLAGNGNIFLINPNGIVFGESAVVNTHGLVASTLNINAAEFGNQSLDMQATQPGSVVTSAGFIQVTEGGAVVLAGSHAENTGYISAPDGHVFIVGADRITLLDTQNPAIAVDVTNAVGNAINDGVINATGGQVDLDGALVKNCDCVLADRLVLTEYGELQIVSSPDPQSNNTNNPNDPSNTGQNVSRDIIETDVAFDDINVGCSSADSVVPELPADNFLTETELNDLITDINDDMGSGIGGIGLGVDDDEPTENTAVTDSPNYQPPCI